MLLCDNKNCFNNNPDKHIFCDSCLTEMASNLSSEELYELYLECEDELKEMAKKDKSQECLKEIKLVRDSLFCSINKLMLIRNSHGLE